MGLLEWQEVPLQQRWDLVRDGGLPIRAFVLPAGRLGPQVHDDVDGLTGHGTVLTVHAVDPEHLPVGGRPRRGEPDVETTAREVIQHGDPVGQLGRMVVRQAEATEADADVLRLAEPFHDEQVRHKMRFTHHGVMLADPELLDPSSSAQMMFCKSLVAVLETALRRMAGHREYAELHAFPFPVQVVVAPGQP